MSRPIWYDSAETGAPTLNNAAGSLLEVLRACLINGFNLRTVTSIVVASGVATATAATHGYSAAYGKLLRIEGAPVAGLNGDVQPLTVDTNTFTYACPGVPDGTYTGTITARRAPLGWTEAFTGTNVAIFSRTDIAALPWSLRVVDTGAAPASSVDARWLAVKTPTGIDSYAAQAPDSGVIGGAGIYVPKGPNNTTAKRWVVVGDGLSFWLLNDYSEGPDRLAPTFFGDGGELFQVDSGRTLLIGSQDAYSSFANTVAGLVFHLNANGSGNASVFCSDVAGLGASVAAKMVGIASGNEALGSSSNATAPANIAIVGPLLGVPMTTNTPRCKIPGLFQPLAFEPFSHVTVNVAGGRRFLAVTHSSYGKNGQMLFDLTGPWQ